MCVAELCAKSGWWKGGAGKGRVLGGQCPPPHGPTLPLLLFVALLLSPHQPPPSRHNMGKLRTKEIYKS